MDARNCMSTEIPNVEISIVSTPITVSKIPCDKCGILMFKGMAYHPPLPKWINTHFRYRIYVWYYIHIQRKIFSKFFHRECAPKGWWQWKFEFLSDVAVYHSIDVEQDLIDVIKEKA